MEITKEKISYLEKKANELRNIILDMAIASGGHIASSFSCVEILVTLYYGKYLNYDPKNPEWEKRDRFLLTAGPGQSKGSTEKTVAAAGVLAGHDVLQHVHIAER